MATESISPASLRAEDYESEVRLTIPLHAELLTLAINAVLAAAPSASPWLDTGCGPGRLAQLARARAPSAALFLADPSPAMLALARARHADLPPERFMPCASDALPEGAPPFAAITALQCHHYYPDAAGRARALARCFARLAPGGLLFTSENVRADSERGQAQQRARWAAWLAAQGRAPGEVAAQLAREGTAFFPLRVGELAALLRGAGFEDVELVWRSHGQAAFVAFRPA